MSLTALLARCLLALALVANGLPAMAMSADPADTAATAECHEAAGHQAAVDIPATSGMQMDCCDGDCACSCLHHAPAVLGLAFVPATVPPGEPRAIRSGRIAPGPALLPSLRPPITG
jgi:hypothetical protein